MTRFNNKYPYTDFHELNADWLLETVKDAAAEAQEASDTVATYNDRLTTVEGDLAPIKAAMPGIASDVSGLKHDVGIMDSLITDTINPGLDTLKNEVETPSTGLLDRMTAAEGKVDEHDNDINNIEGRMTTYDQDFVNINNALLSDQRRINSLEDYRTEAQVKIGNLGYSIAPLFDETAGYHAGDYVMSPNLKLHRALVDIPAGSANIDDLTQFMPTDINDALYEDISGVTYSTTERVVGKWIDDSDIYQKTFYISNLPNASLFQMQHYIANLGRVIEISGAGYDSNSGTSIGIPYVNTSVENQVACYVNTTYIFVNTGGNLSQYDAYITIKYLKTA